VAAKEIMSTTMDPDNIQEFEHEARMLTQLNHPQVLRVFGFCSKTAEESKDNQERRYIVTEFAPNGSLESVVEGAIKIAKIIKDSNSGAIQMPFTKTKALEWAIQIASGMAFLHSKGYVHRDMKPHNVLLNKSMDALVADLGFVRRPKENNNDDTNDYTNESKHMGIVDATATAIKNDQAMTTMTGTPMYMAPEQITRDNYSYPVDVWAYGVTLVRLFTLKQPYNKNFHEDRIMGGIASGTMYPVKVKREDVPHEEVLRVINDCLQMKAKLRPSFKMIEERLVIALEKCTKGSINN
jgi:serine/threonine protein kinase